MAQFVSAPKLKIKSSFSAMTIALMVLTFYNQPYNVPVSQCVHAVATLSAILSLFWHLTQPPMPVLSHTLPAIVIQCPKQQADWETPRSEVSLQSWALP